MSHSNRCSRRPKRPPAGVADRDADQQRGREDRRDEWWYAQAEHTEHHEREQGYHSGSGSVHRGALPDRLARLHGEVEDRAAEDQDVTIELIDL